MCWRKFHTIGFCVSLLVYEQKIYYRNSHDDQTA
jgi:hypothetical protein